MINNLLISTLLTLTLISPAAHSQDAPAETKPRFDPFKKPQHLLKAAVKPEKPEKLFQTNLKLFATLRSGENSMVNIQGKLVQLGEEIEGYKLVEVNDRSAVFANHEQRILLSLDSK